MSTNKIVTVDSASLLLSKYMNAESMSNSNLYRNEFPTDNLIEGRIVFIKVPDNMIEEGGN